MASSNGEYSTVIGPDARFKGELQFEKNAQLLGKFEGQIITQGEFVVAEGARLEGEVQAATIRLDGEVQGNLRATGKIQLSASAKLEGDLQTARLEVADGAIFIGHCAVGANGEAGGKARDKRGVAEPAHAKGKPSEAASAVPPLPDPARSREGAPEPVLSKK
ncbi:MAG TPA: polymer-forming cytoskeletal protein [Phycisphaerae bacterium]|nr:polymer-forming cytoskeletal protein [Phycisphaerae bacterium]